MSDKKILEILEKKQNLEIDLKTIEKQIYDLETKYLEETQSTGNILKGWDLYFITK